MNSLETQIPPLPAIPDGVEPFEVTKALAAAVHPQIINELAFRATDPTISTSNLLSISDHIYKVSGLSAKTEPKAAGPGFSIQIILGDSPGASKTITLGAAEYSTDPLETMPAFMSGAGSGNLEVLI